MFSIDISKCEGQHEGPVSTRERIVELRLLCIILFAVIVFLIIYFLFVEACGLFFATFMKISYLLCVKWIFSFCFLIFVIERRNRPVGHPHLACSSVLHPKPL